MNILKWLWADAPPAFQVFAAIIATEVAAMCGVLIWAMLP